MKKRFRISEQEKEIVMRRSNWKSKRVVVIAVIIGILCGLAAAYFVNQKFGAAYIGLTFFITMPVVAGLLMFLMIRVFHIGD
jgi:Na+/H+-dicarboxylate symporter